MSASKEEQFKNLVHDISNKMDIVGSSYVVIGDYLQDSYMTVVHRAAVDRSFDALVNFVSENPEFKGRKIMLPTGPCIV